MAETPQKLATILSQLATLFEPEIVRQINRSAVLSSLLRWLPIESGKRVEWVVEGDGHIFESYAEDANPANYAVDKLVNGNLAHAQYWAPFSLTEAAAAGAQNTGNPAGATNLLRRYLENSLTKLADGINGKLFNGTGANEIIGMETGIDSTGVYASIDQGVDAFWASTEDGNGAVNRPLTTALMRKMKRNLIIQSGEAPDIWITTPALADKYGELAGSRRSSLDLVQTSGRSIKVIDVGWTALEFDGAPVVADRQCTANHMYALNSRYIIGRWLPFLQLGDEGNQPGTTLFGQLPVKFIQEGRQGDRIKILPKAWPQLEITKRNAHGKIFDLDET